MKHKSGEGGGTTGGADKRPSGAEQPQGTAVTRVNAEQDATGRETQPPPGGGAQPPAGAGQQEAKGGQKTTSRGAGWGGSGVGVAQQQAATNTRARPGAAQTRESGAPAREHERQGDYTCETKTRGGTPHALGGPARPTRPGQRNGAPHALGRPARLSRPAKHHRKPTPDNAGHTAAETTANQQNRPSMEPATTPQTETPTRRHSTPHQAGGLAQTRDAPTGGGARTSTAPTPARQKPQTTNSRQRRPYGGRDNSKPTKQAEHRAGYNTTNQNLKTPTQHAPPRGGPRTNTARPNREGGHAPAYHQPWPSKQHKHNRNPPNRRRQPKPNTTTAAGSTNTARPTKRGATHQHSTPHQEGGHRPTQHAPP